MYVSWECAQDPKKSTPQTPKNITSTLPPIPTNLTYSKFVSETDSTDEMRLSSRPRTSRSLPHALHRRGHRSSPAPQPDGPHEQRSRPQGECDHAAHRSGNQRNRRPPPVTERKEPDKKKAKGTSPDPKAASKEKAEKKESKGSKGMNLKMKRIIRPLLESLVRKKKMQHQEQQNI